MLVNLLSNANKFTSKGLITVSVDLEQKSNDNWQTFNSWLLIKVADQGIGISEEHKDLLFVPFTCLEEGKHLNPNGCGLGLSICKTVLEKLDSEIWIDRS